MNQEDKRFRARRYYAASVILFQYPSEDDCKVVIALLDKAVVIDPDFSEARVLRGDVWHYLIKSNWHKYYDEYLKSAAWNIKRNLVRERDNNQCACGDASQVVHHKTYLNVGKEPLYDLVSLCNECHKRYHGLSEKPMKRWRETNELSDSLPPVVVLEAELAVLDADTDEFVIPGEQDFQGNDHQTTLPPTNNNQSIQEQVQVEDDSDFEF